MVFEHAVALVTLAGSARGDQGVVVSSPPVAALGIIGQVASRSLFREVKQRKLQTWEDHNPETKRA